MFFLIENEPLLFIDTVSENRNGVENMSVYDSRNKPKKNIDYRLEDIKAMLLYKFHVNCEIKTSTAIYNGLVVGITDNYVCLKTNNLEVNISIQEIDSITIISK